MQLSIYISHFHFLSNFILLPRFLLFHPLNWGGWWRFSSTLLVLCFHRPSSGRESRHPTQTFVLNDKLSPQGTTAKTFLIKRPPIGKTFQNFTSYLVPNAQYASLSLPSVDIFIFTLPSIATDRSLSSFKTVALGLTAKLKNKFIDKQCDYLWKRTKD